MFRTASARAAVFLCALASAACSDRGDPVTAPAPPLQPALEVAQIQCRVAVAQQAMSCDRPGAAGDARAAIFGGQGQYMFLASSGTAFTAADSTLRSNVTVQNLIPQPLGTTDGSTPSPTGVRVIFHTGPTVTSGSGTVTVANADGTGTFTAGGQPFFQYSGALLGADSILATNETSGARQWGFRLDPGVAAFVFTVYVVADVPFPNGYITVTPGADTLQPGGAQAFSAVVHRPGGDVDTATVTWGTSDPAVATVDGSGNVTAVAPGTVTITATSGLRSGSATLAVCPTLAVGGVYVADMPAGSSFCLAGAAEYTVVPVNLDQANPVSLDVTGSGIVAVSGPPSPIRGPLASSLFRSRPAPRLDDRFEARLRQRERRELAPRLLSSRAAGAIQPPAGPRRAITPGVPAVGALMSLNVETSDFCGEFDTRTGRVIAVGTHIVVIADTTNPSGGLGAAQYQALADSFDTFIWPTLTANFGAPADIDDNGGRVIAFFTRAVNEQTPGGATRFVPGYFLWRDLRPAAECPTSNVGEMIYLPAADPSGEVNGNARGVTSVIEEVQQTLAHEMEHLINASRRFYVTGTTELAATWLDEGLAHIAQELVFYSRSGLAPGQNVDAADLGVPAVQDAFFRYMYDNFARLDQWLLAPDTSGPFQDDADSATRGAAWAFLRYAADRRGGTQAAFWQSLVDGDGSAPPTGLALLQEALGTDPLPWFRDFAAAMYADDAAGSPPAAYTQPSWNFRDLYANLDFSDDPACSCSYRLAALDLDNGVASSFTLSYGGAAAYRRLGVPGNAFAGVTVRSGGDAPPATVKIAVIRRE